MTHSFLKKSFAVIWGVFIFSAIIIYLVGGKQFHYTQTDTGGMVSATNDIGEMITGTDIFQNFCADFDEINSLEVLGGDYSHSVGGTMTVTLLNEEGQRLYERDFDMADFGGDGLLKIDFDSPIEVEKGKNITLRIYASDGSSGSVPTLYYGSAVSLSRGQMALELKDSDKVSVNGETLDGKLCFRVYGQQPIAFGSYYWAVAAVIAVLLAAFTVYQLLCEKKGRKTRFHGVLASIQRYRYLVSQLVARDFKRKYKRSVLGVLWSLFNPMLIMIVQYIVFSTIFKSDIENFAVYLLSGIVCYNFFSEVTNMSLTSIVENSSLITKVYIPKCVYPISRALSSGINFLLSLIPLIAVLLFTRTPITYAVAVLPFAMVCLFMLALGIGLALSASMVFFRDTQFIWNVVNMIWMYMTPIFYPESIITGWLSYIFKLNPLYHIIRFFRIILLEGISPEPKAYLLCFLASAIPLLIGSIIFNKTKDKFVLNI